MKPLSLSEADILNFIADTLDAKSEIFKDIGELVDNVMTIIRISLTETYSTSDEKNIRKQVNEVLFRYKNEPEVKGFFKKLDSLDNVNLSGNLKSYNEMSEGMILPLLRMFEFYGIDEPDSYLKRLFKRNDINLNIASNDIESFKKLKVSLLSLGGFDEKFASAIKTIKLEDYTALRDYYFSRCHSSDLLRLYSNFYYNLKFNVTSISPDINVLTGKGNPYKTPSNKFDTYELERQNQLDMGSLSWEDSTGIGVILGFNNLRALDFDGCNDLQFIKFVLDKLNLGTKYEWLVRSGSNNGFHILFYAENHSFPLKPEGVKAFFPNDANKLKFQHFELRWYKHLVLPPSLSKDNFRYQFVNCVLPSRPPKKINISLIEELVESLSGKNGSANSILDWKQYIVAAYENEEQAGILDFREVKLNEIRNLIIGKKISNWIELSKSIFLKFKNRISFLKLPTSSKQSKFYWLDFAQFLIVLTGVTLIVYRLFNHHIRYYFRECIGLALITATVFFIFKILNKKH
jgi:hypothetical protein